MGAGRAPQARCRRHAPPTEAPLARHRL